VNFIVSFVHLIVDNVFINFDPFTSKL
jgi:hypothetical protein